MIALARGIGHQAQACLAGSQLEWDFEPEVLILLAVLFVIALAWFGWLDVADRWTDASARVAITIAVAVAVIGTVMLFVTAHQQ